MCELRDVFIVGAARTAIGNFLGSLKNFKAPELGGFAIKEAVKRAGISGEDVEEVIMGNVVTGGLGQAPTKQAAMKGENRSEDGAPVVFTVDESPREDTALEKLAKIKPAFKKDGTVTAGNASSLNDGASVVVVASEARISTTLIYALKHRGFKKGVASLCLGGGDAVAMALEMV